MSRESTERAAMLAVLVSRHVTTDDSGGVPAHYIAARVCHLQRIARQARKSAEHLCNIPDYQERHDAKMLRLRKHAADICADLGAGFSVSLGGDPRGPCCWLTIPGEPGEGFSHDGKSYSVF